MLFRVESILTHSSVSCDQDSLPVDILGLDPGQRVVLPLRGSYVVDTVKLEHTVPALGYVIKQPRVKLRAQYIGAPAADIVEVGSLWWTLTKRSSTRK